MVVELTRKRAGRKTFIIDLKYILNHLFPLKSLLLYNDSWLTMESSY